MTRQKAIDTDVCILGAGPHGLAAALHLLQAKPSIKLLTVDPSGRRLSTWHNQMARSEITTLRSPIVHSPAPSPSALARHISDHRFASSGLPYDIPTVEAFASYCTKLSSGLDAPITSRPLNVTREREIVRIETDDITIDTNHLVVATNPHRQQTPHWTQTLVDDRSGVVVHVNDLDLQKMPDLTGQEIAVVGGGLSAAHLACGATKREANVSLIARSPPSRAATSIPTQGGSGPKTSAPSMPSPTRTNGSIWLGLPEEGAQSRRG